MCSMQCRRPRATRTRRIRLIRYFRLEYDEPAPGGDFRDRVQQNLLLSCCTVKGSYASHTAALEAHFRACAPLDAGRSGFAGVVSGARPVVERAELPATEELPTVDEPEEGRPRALRMAPS